ncbi:MAG: hypothetical protein ACT4QG_16065 [Sporichthyaceae bacterium]
MNTVGAPISRKAVDPRHVTPSSSGRFVALDAAEHLYSILVASSGRFAAVGEPAGGAVAIVAAENFGSGTARDEGFGQPTLWLGRVLGGAWKGKAGQTRGNSDAGPTAKYEGSSMHEDKPKRVLRVGQYQGRVVARRQADADSVSSVRRTSVCRPGEPALGVMGGHLSAGVLTGAAPGVVAFEPHSSSTTAPAPTGDVQAQGCVARSQNSGEPLWIHV